MLHMETAQQMLVLVSLSCLITSCYIPITIALPQTISGLSSVKDVSTPPDLPPLSGQERNYVNFNNMDTSTLHERNAAKLQNREYVIGICTEKEYYDWYYNVYELKCRYLMGNRTYDEEKYLIFCDKECGAPYLEFLTSCGGEIGALYADYYRNLCYKNSYGVTCAYYFVAVEYVQPTYYIEENCKVPYENDTCSFDCRTSLHQLKFQIGCCVNNIYNHSVPSDLAHYSLWSKCGVTTPGYCSREKGLVISVFTSVVLLIFAFTM